MRPTTAVVRSRKTSSRQSRCPDFACCSKVERVWVYTLGKTCSIKVSRFDPAKNLNPAFRCIFHSSPSELIMPRPPTDLCQHWNLTHSDIGKHTKQVPRPRPEEVAFGDNTLISENKLDVLGVIDDDSGRQRRN